MNVRHIFGKPLPKALRFGQSTGTLSWLAAAVLLLGAGAATWIVMVLLARDSRDMEEMVYFWPE